MRLAALALVPLVGALAAGQPEAGEPDAVVLLIGDAGDPRPGGEPVLRALTREASRAPERTTVVFLGDNLYPRGLPAADDRSRPEAERRLRDQIDSVRLPGLRAVFLPGNHDWDNGGEDGLAAVRRQGQFVRNHGAPGVALLPEGGCPGPEVRDIGLRLRLVLLDSQWFLHPYGKPQEPASGCAADSDTEVVSALKQALAGAGDRDVLVAAHHPLETGGPHGGRFTARQHVFPLTDWKPWLWLPLPVIGSAYPVARKAGVTPQDLTSDEYERFRALMREAMSGRPPLAWAAGHEHTLQVIQGAAPRHVLVSGTGIHGHTDPVARLPGTRFAASRAGFMRLAVPRSGVPRLSVLVVDGKGEASERFSMDLE